MKGGNYTCHLSPSGEYLNHTMILIQLNPDNRTVILENREGGKLKKKERRKERSKDKERSETSRGGRTKKACMKGKGQRADFL